MIRALLLVIGLGSTVGAQMLPRLASLPEPQATPPRILSATFTAALQGNDLVGDGVLQIAATAPTMLPLDPLSIALSEPKWKTGAAASLDRMSESTRLWIDAGSGTDFLFHWSARGREEPGVLRFDLRLPAVAIAALELDLPVGRTVSASDALVEGPLPTAKPNLSRWRIAFGGKSKLEIAVANTAASAVAVGFNRNAKYDLASGAATFDFEIEALRGPVPAWTFRVDPEVRVLDVVTPNRDTWQFDAARRELTITLRETASHGRATIHATMTIPQSGPPWPCAGVHGLGAAGSDAIELRMGSDPRLEAWEPGDYTLSRITPLADRGYLLALVGSWRTAATGRKPPLLTLRPTQPSANTNIMLDWHLSPVQNRLSASIRFAVQHGPVTQVAFKLPAGYTPGVVRFSPDDPAANSQSTATTLTLEPSRPWSAGQTIEARFELRGPPIEAGKPIPIPRVVPSSSTAFDGMLTVTLDAGLRFFDRTGQSLQQPIGSRDRDPALVVVPAPAIAPEPPRAPAPATTWDIASRAAATIDDAGVVRVQLAGTIHRAGAARLPIALPPDGVLEWAMVNGKYIEAARQGNLLSLPVNTAGGESFEVQYRRPAPLRAVVTERPPVTPMVLDQPVEVAWSHQGSYRTLLPSSGMLVHRSAIAILAVLLFGFGIVLYWVARRVRSSWRAAPLAGLLLAGGLSGQPADRVDKLSEAARPPVAFTGATVTGSADETHATYDLTLTAISANDQEQIVVLPLQAIALESVTLDGAAAFPVTVGSRFTLPVRGAGPHTITVRGRVLLVVKGADREAILPLDALPMARLTMTLSPLARSIRVPNRDGRIRSERKFSGTTVEADLGSASPVVLRWRSGGLIDQPARVSAIGATLWDLTPGEAAVTAAFNVNVEEGSLSGLAFEIPANLEPGRVVIRTADGAAIGIGDSQLTANANGSRTYVVQLAEPLEGANSIVLQLSPLAPLSTTPQLTVVKLAAAREADSVLLARVASPVERWERSGFVELTIEAVAREFGPVPELGLERSPPLAYRRQGGGEAWLRPVLAPTSLPQPVAVDAAWLFGEKATIIAAVRYSKDANLAAVEFEVPAAVVVSEVVAPDLAGWSRTGNRVRTWFRTPPRDLTLKWYGTWPMPKLPATIELPMPSRIVPSRIVRLKAEDKFSVQVVPGSGWRGAITMTPGETALVASVPPAPLKLKLDAR